MKKLYKDKGWLKFQYHVLGRSAEEIAEECEVSPVDIFRQLRDFNLLQLKASSRISRKIPKYQDKEWLYHNYVTLKKSPQEIASELNVSDGTILRWLKVFGIKIRGAQGGMWTDEKWLRHQYYDLKRTAREIAELCDTSMSTICYWMRRFGIKARKYKWQRQKDPKKPKYMDKEWLRKQYLDLRKTTVQIATECGCSHRTISMWLKKFGIPSRSPSESKLRGHEKYANENWLRKQFLELKKSVKEIAQDADVSVATINKWLKKFNIREEKVYLFHDEQWLYQQYWEYGKTIDQISKEFGIGTTNIYRWMRRYNIPRRKHFDYRRPSGLELQFLKFIEKNRLSFRYVGNDPGEKIDVSKFPVPWNTIYPDFKHESMKVAIEVGDKQQKTKLSQKTPYNNWQEYEKMRKEAYKQAGWKLIIVWEDEIDNNPERILNEIKTACGLK